MYLSREAILEHLPSADAAAAVAATRRVVAGVVFALTLYCHCLGHHGGRGELLCNREREEGCCKRGGVGAHTKGVEQEGDRGHMRDLQGHEWECHCGGERQGGEHHGGEGEERTHVRGCGWCWCWRAPVRPMWSLQAKVSMLIRMRVRGTVGPVRGTSWMARRCVGRMGEERLRTATLCVFIRWYTLEGAVFATFSAWHRALCVMVKEEEGEWEERVACLSRSLSASQ